MCIEISDSSVSTGVLDLLKSFYFDLCISFVVYVCNCTDWQIK